MAESTQQAHQPEQTFRAYTTKQGANYAQGRPGYHPNLLKRIIDHHVSTGGQLGTVVDVGCGPGTVVRPMAEHFDRAVGFDPSEGMVSTGRELGGVSGNGEPIRFEQTTAEALGAGLDVVPDGTADLITAAAAAHWFDMPKFWVRAGQLLRPGGTVALVITLTRGVHPSVPNADAINAAWEDIERQELDQFKAPGNLSVEKLYADLALPWTMAEPVTEFDQATYYRKEWGTPGNDSAEAEGQELMVGNNQWTMKLIELGMSTASPVTRWREANPDKAGTEADVVKRIRGECERLLHEAGVPEGQEVVRGLVKGALIMVKKKA